MFHEQPSEPVSLISGESSKSRQRTRVTESSRDMVTVRNVLPISDASLRGRSRRRGRRKMIGSRAHRAVHRALCTEPSYARSTRLGRAAVRDAGCQQ